MMPVNVKLDISQNEVGNIAILVLRKVCFPIDDYFYTNM